MILRRNSDSGLVAPDTYKASKKQRKNHNQMASYTFKLDNVHCSSCEQAIEKTLSELNPAPHQIHVSIAEKTVAVNAPVELHSSVIAKQLLNAGFDVAAINNHTLPKNDNWLVRRYNGWRRSKIHKQTCGACHDSMNEKGDPHASFDSGEFSHVTFDTPQQEYRAIYSIGGMTCASCVSTIETALGDEYNFSCNLLGNSGSAVINDKRQANVIQEKIRDMGYECDLVEILPVSSSRAWKVTASIGGMSCVSCTSTITELVTSQPYVQEANVSVLTHSGEFIVNDQSKVDELKEIVEDAGFEYHQVEVKEVRQTTNDTKSRVINLEVDGMYCEHCPDKINHILDTYGNSVTIDDPISLAQPFIKFTYVPNPPRVSIRTILEKIHSLSPQFKARIVHPMTIEERSALVAKKERKGLALRLALAVIIAIPTFILGIVGMQLLPHDSHLAMYLDEPMWVGSVSRDTWAVFFLATPVYFFAADVFHRKAIHEILGLWRRGVPWRRRLFKFGSMSLLMCLGTTIAYFASIVLLVLSARVPAGATGYTSTYFDSVVFLTMFLLIGRLLDSVSKARTASAVSLLNLRPDSVQLIESVDLEAESRFGESTTVDLDLVEPGDFVRVLPGMSCPTDGIVFEGTSSFNESALTGESMPVVHAVGDQVFAGTINCGTSSVVVKVTAIEGLLDSIIDVVRQGQMNRAPIERVAEKITGVFVPIITLLAASTWIIWLILGETGALPQSYLDIDVGGWPVWSLQFAIAVFVVACPCGIGLAAPTALFIGTGLAAKHGILARGGGEAFQEGANVDVVCFDKTGTLTKGGEPTITDEHVIEDTNLNRQLLLGIAKSLEDHSSHPLATAVKAYSEDYAQVDNVSELAGKGLIGTTQYGKAIIGNERLMNDYNADIPEQLSALIHSWKLEGKSVILMAIESNGSYTVRLFLAAADEIRAESKAVVESLNRRGIQCWMISGDNEDTAKAVARQVSIPESNVIAGVLPNEKSEQIKWLQKTGNHANKKARTSRAIVAMVGDGINDAPSLSVADVGIAIGSGSDIALSSAKFVLLKSNLNSILILLDIAKKTFTRIKFNFGWALVYNCIGIPIAAGVIYPYNNSRLDPVWASLAMALSSVSVVMSSLLLKFYKPAKDIAKL